MLFGVLGQKKEQTNKQKKRTPTYRPGQSYLSKEGQIEDYHVLVLLGSTLVISISVSLVHRSTCVTSMCIPYYWF